jgi:hypothetical protein
MRPPPEITTLVSLARVSGWPIERITEDGIALETPAGGLLVVVRCTAGGWFVVPTLHAPELPTGGVFDLASSLAGLIASSATWPLHRVVDSAARLVDGEP